MKDITIICKKRGEEFAFTVADQCFFKEKGLEKILNLCMDCFLKKRTKKKQR